MKGYVFRLYQTDKQEELIGKSFGCSRYIYNYFLSKSNGYINTFNSCKKIKELIKENNWLKEVDSCLLRCSVFNLEDSFKKYKNKISEYPKFKSKNKSRLSYRTNNVVNNINGKTYNSIEIDLERKIIKLPKLKEVSIRGYRNLKNINASINIMFEGLKLYMKNCSQFKILTFVLDIYMLYFIIGGKMNRIIKKKILNIVTFCILLVVPFLKFFSMNLEMFKIIGMYDYINPAIVLYISIPFLLFVYIKDLKDSKRKLDIFDYLFYILVIVDLISTILSINRNIAIFGKDYRHEGLLSILSYYLLFINWKVLGNKEDIKKYIKLFIIIGIINSIYALLQIYTPFNFILRYSLDTKMASGLCGNPNFFGSLIVTVISIVTCSLLISEKNILEKVIVIVLLFISLINAQSTGPFLTYILFILLLIGFLYKKKSLVLKNILILLVVLVTTYISVFLINKYVYKYNRCEMCDIKQTINNGGTGRIDIWKKSFDIVKNNFIFGVGFDNFYLAYPNPKIDNSVSFIITSGVVEKEVKSYFIVDNAHNIYIHTWVSNGILGLIPYLLLCLFTFIKGLKSNNKFIFLLLSGFVAYSIQGFANISVIQVAPIYFVIIGLILSHDSRTNKSLT